MPNRPQTDEAAAIKAARPELNGQKFRPVIYQGITLEKYKIAPDGLVRSLHRKEEQSMSWTATGARGWKYPGVTLAVPCENLQYVDKTKSTYKKRTNTSQRKVKVHILVADAWGDEMACPREFEPYWDNLPLAVKKIMRKFFEVDHIDNNKLNNHVDNLRFVSSRDNQYHVKGDALGDSPKEALDRQAKIDTLIKEQRNKK